MANTTNTNLVTWQTCSEFSIEKVHALYGAYVNKGQVDLMRSFGFGRLVANSAQGCEICLNDGRKILDMTGGVGVLGHGHNHPRLLKARIDYQTQTRMEVHKNFLSQYVAGLAHNIAHLLPDDLNISYFCNSGTEAVEGALKLAYKYHNGKRAHVLHADLSFHGKSFACGGLTGSPEVPFRWPTIPGIKPFVYNDSTSVETCVADLRRSNGKSDIYAIVIEPYSVSSLTGCSTQFLRQLREVCNREDIILIFDEVFTGWAKTDDLFCFMTHGVLPDIVTMSKTFGGGKSSISAFTTRTPIFEKAYGNLHDAILHSTTYNGFGEECVTAMEAIAIINDDDYVAKARHIGHYMRSRLNALQKKYPDIIQEVRGIGLLNGIVLNSELNRTLRTAIKFVPLDLFKDPQFAKKLVTGSVISELFNRHNILTFFGSNHNIPLMFHPPNIVTDDEIDRVIDGLDQTLARGISTLLVNFASYKFLKKKA